MRNSKRYSKIDLYGNIMTTEQRIAARKRAYYRENSAKNTPISKHPRFEERYDKAIEDYFAINGDPFLKAESKTTSKVIPETTSSTSNLIKSIPKQHTRSIPKPRSGLSLSHYMAGAGLFGALTIGAGLYYANNRHKKDYDQTIQQLNQRRSK